MKGGALLVLGAKHHSRCTARKLPAARKRWLNCVSVAPAASGTLSGETDLTSCYIHGGSWVRYFVATSLAALRRPVPRNPTPIIEEAKISINRFYAS